MYNRVYVLIDHIIGQNPLSPVFLTETSPTGLQKAPPDFSGLIWARPGPGAVGYEPPGPKMPIPRLCPGVEER